MSDKNYLHSLNFGLPPAIQKIKFNPPFCECARITSRPLNAGSRTTLNAITRSSSTLDAINLKASHEHITWDQSKDNIGFRGANDELGIWPFEAKGELFSENIENKNYVFSDPNCYDGELMREAVIETGQPAGYRMFGYNCQEYIENVKNKFKALGRAICY